MTTVRFDKAESLANKGLDHTICRMDMPTVPMVGEIVSIDGEPYVVLDRGWAIGEVEGLEDRRSFAYLRMWHCSKEVT